MKYLLFLNRFEFDKDKLITKLRKLDNHLEVKTDPAGLSINSKIKIEEFLNFHEIRRVVNLFNDWKTFNFKDLKEDCLSLAKKFNFKDYFIDNKFYDKVKISSKSLYRHINPYLKHENILVNENSKNIIYLEIKKFDDRLKYRLSYITNSNFMEKSVLNVDFSKFVVILENPNLVLEVSDFLRLCWIFKIPLYFVVEDKSKFEGILNRAKKETKGIDYSKMMLKVLYDLPTDFVLVGFSKHAKENEKEMKNIMGQLILDPSKKIALVFGDDKFGLGQETRDKLDYCFRLTPELKKPLRGSHALSYVLGFYVNGKI